VRRYRLITLREFNAELITGCKFTGTTAVQCVDYDSEGEYIIPKSCQIKYELECAHYQSVTAELEEAQSKIDAAKEAMLYMADQELIRIQQQKIQRLEENEQAKEADIAAFKELARQHKEKISEATHEFQAALEARKQEQLCELNHAGALYVRVQQQLGGGEEEEEAAVGKTRTGTLKGLGRKTARQE